MQVPPSNKRHAALATATRLIVGFSGAEVFPANALCGPTVLDIRRAAGAAESEQRVAREARNKRVEMTATIDVEIDDDWIRRARASRDAKWESSWPRWEAESIANGRFIEAIAGIVLCAQVARPGDFYVSEARLPKPRSFINDEPAVPQGTLDGAINAVAQLGWPRLHPLEPADVLRWAQKASGWSNARDEGRVGGALGALSRIIDDDPPFTDSGSQLLWAIHGLEELYCELTKRVCSSRGR